MRASVRAYACVLVCVCRCVFACVYVCTNVHLLQCRVCACQCLIAGVMVCPAPHQLIMVSPQGAPLSPVLYNVIYTKGLAERNQTGTNEIHWQRPGSYTKHQGTPRRQPKQCNNNWIAYPSDVTTPDFSPVQTRRKHCGVLLTTEQQANR